MTIQMGLILTFWISTTPQALFYLQNDLLKWSQYPLTLNQALLVFFFFKYSGFDLKNTLQKAYILDSYLHKCCCFDLFTLSITGFEETTSYNVVSPHLTSKNFQINQKYPQQF